MARTIRRPTPITLPHYPMDTLWEVDESLDQLPSRSRLRSVFEDDDDVSFPLPPRSLPPMKRFLSKMSLSARPVRSPPKPTRAPPAVPRPVSPAVLITRPVSPTSSASSSDTEPPRTPPAASTSLPAYVLAPPPPAEWESAIDALFEIDQDDEEEQAISSKWSSSSSTPRASPIPIIRPTDSYLSFSPPCSPPRMSFMHSAKSPLPPSMSVYPSASLPMSPTFNRPLASPGLLPTSPTSPSVCPWPTVPVRTSIPLRPARSSRRMGMIPVRIES